MAGTSQRAGRPATHNKVVEMDPGSAAVQQDGDFDLNAIVAQRQEALDLEDGHLLHFVWSGKRYTMPYPMFADDEWNDELQSLTDNRDIAVHCLGEAQYELFKADGGKASFVAFLLQEANARVASAGDDGTPTRSAPSSRRTRRQRR